MICVYCNEEITDGKYKLVAFDTPYLNLHFHPDCLIKVGDMQEYVEQNLSRLLRADSQQPVKKKTKRSKK